MPKGKASFRAVSYLFSTERVESREGRGAVETISWAIEGWASHTWVRSERRSLGERVSSRRGRSSGRPAAADWLRRRLERD